MLKLVFEWCRVHIRTVFAQHPQPFPPRFSQEIPEIPQNRRKEHPGSPRKSRKHNKIAENNTQVLPGNPGNTTKSQKITPRFSQEIPETHKIAGNHQFPVRTWEDLGGNSWDWGFVRRAWDPRELQKLVRGKVAGGWPAILTHNF